VDGRIGLGIIDIDDDHLLRPAEEELDAREGALHREIACCGLAADGIPERTAGLSHPRLGKDRYPPTERSPGNRVDVVEVHYAIARDAITLRGELEFRYEIPLGSG
jgi:hypothetical protein